MFGVGMFVNGEFVIVGNGVMLVIGVVDKEIVDKVYKKVVEMGG